MRTSIRTTRARAAALALAGAGLLGACQDATAPDDATLDLSAAFTSIPAGYSAAANSYAGSAPALGLWAAGGRTDRLADGALMGGGLRDAFVGGEGFGAGGPRGHRGPFGGGVGCAGGAGGTFDAASGRVVCADETVGGVTIARSASYATAAGVVQQAFDSLTTDVVNVRVSASGTITFDSTNGRGHGGMGFRHGGREGKRGGIGGLLGDTATIVSATSTVQSASERTTRGLAQGSTQRRVDGTSRAQESTTGKTTLGDFTATRLAGDTTVGLVIPVATSATTPPYPTAGTVVRSMRVTVAYTGQTPVSATRREVVTYDGSATARVTITQDGTTKNCTRPLPRGPLTCS